MTDHKPAPAPMPEECECNEGYGPCGDCASCRPDLYPKSSPAPMPEDDEAMCARLLSACKGHPNAMIPWPHRLLHDAVDHITAITRRLAEVEAELSAIEAEVGRRPVEKCTLDAVKYALHTAWAQSDANGESWRRNVARAEAAEAKLRGLQADSKDAYANYAKSGRESYARLRRAEAAEAKLKRIMAWARGRCDTCELMRHDVVDRYMRDPGCAGCEDGSNWTEPKEWEGEE